MDGRCAWRDNVFVERCGSRSSTKRSTCMRMTPWLQPSPASENIFPSTTAGVRTQRLTGILPITFTSTLSRSRRLHNPRSCTYPGRENRLNWWGHLCASPLTESVSDHILDPTRIATMPPMLRDRFKQLNYLPNRGAFQASVERPRAPAVNRNSSVIPGPACDPTHCILVLGVKPVVSNLSPDPMDER